MKTKGQKGFAIVNIICGVIVFMASFAMLAESGDDPSYALAGIVMFLLGLAFGICGWLTLRRLRSDYIPENTMKITLKVNFILFIVAVIIVTGSTVLSIIGPMLF